MFKEIISEDAVKLALEKSCIEEEFYVEYQPQMNIKPMNRSIFGIEALVRWKNESIGQVSPGIFIPKAESSGRIHEIGEFVLEQSIKAAKEWYDKGFNFSHIAVNVSPVELTNPFYLERLIDLCERYGFPHNAVELEVTEGIALEEVENSVEIINAISEAGFKIAIDDFGSGYSNLSSIIGLNVDTIKIDRSIINLLKNKKTQFLIDGIVNFGKGTGSNILAEGVETKEQVGLLEELGCHLIQGYHYSKPLAQKSMEKYLADHS